MKKKGIYKSVMDEVEYKMIIEWMKEKRGKKIKEEDILGIKRNKLRKKIREIGVNIYSGEKKWG